MGTKKISLGDALFTKTQRRVLGLLYGNPDRSYYANEIVRFAGSGIGAVQRELERLEAVRLVTASKIGNQKHYQANRAAPIFDELRGIVLKTFGVADHLRSALAPLAKRIRAAFIYGSVAKGADTASSDIDVMIVSDELSFPDATQALTKAEHEVGRSGESLGVGAGRVAAQGRRRRRVSQTGNGTAQDLSGRNGRRPPQTSKIWQRSVS